MVELGETEELTYEDKLKYVTVISVPLASEKLTNKIHKLVKKASKHEKPYFSFGLKQVQRCIRKGETGMLIMAGDVEPIDTICHLPGVCEEKDIPYIFVPSKEDLGTALGSRASCIVALIKKEHEDYAELYNKVLEKLRKSSDE